METKENLANIQEFGPAGSDGGDEFDDTDQCKIPDNRISKVTVKYGSYIDSISITYISGATRKHGGTGGENEEIIQLEEGEYINEIRGKCGQYIDSLRIITNKKSYTLGGTGGKNKYSLTAPDGYMVNGFFGRSGSYLDAIGIICKKQSI